MQLKGMMYYSYVNIRYAFMIFWMILCGILLLSIGADLIFGADQSSIYFSFSAPIYVFGAIMGYWVVKNIFPYTIKLGSTRNNIYVGAGLVFFLLSVCNALVSNTIHSIITKIYGNTNNIMEFSLESEGVTSSVSFNHIADLIGKNDWLHRFIIDTSISFFFLTVSFMIGLVFYRYHLIGGLSFLGALLLLFIFAVSKGWVWDFVKNVYTDFSFAFFYQLFLTGLVIYLLSYPLIRRMTVSS